MRLWAEKRQAKKGRRCELSAEIKRGEQPAPMQKNLIASTGEHTLLSSLSLCVYQHTLIFLEREGEKHFYYYVLLGALARLYLYNFKQTSLTTCI